MKKYINELIGTFFLVLVIGLTGNPLAIASILMVMVYMGASISGAQYNPAVTLSLLILKKLTAKEALKYMGSQLAGAIIAALMVYLFNDHTFVPAPAEKASVLKVLMLEGLFTFALTSVVLNVAVSKSAAGNSYYGLAIGFTVLVGAIAAGPISGGVFNPAVGVGACIVDGIVGGTGSLANVWLYIVGPCIGAILAAANFSMSNAEA